jgi:ATP-dependent Clp protease ATP-binding subunit ClpB
VLEKEKDKASKARFVEVKKELDDLRDKLQPLMMKYKKKKERVDKIRKLKQKREELLSSLQEAKIKLDLAHVADIRYGTLKEIDTNISRREGETDDNLTLTEIVCPEHIAEVYMH